MIEMQLDASELTRLAEKIEQSPAILREAKRQAFEQAAPKMKKLLDSKIGGTGKVRSWQAQYVGSKGGYAAVRPKAKTWAEDARGKTTKYQVGYVTNAINSGHKFPSPSGKAKRHRKPRIKSMRQNVPGKQFYEAAQSEITKIAQDTANQIVETLRQHLEE